jgi:hypothetical protein
MANWRKRCSYRPARPPDRRQRAALAASLLVLTTTACGQGPVPAAPSPAAPSATAPAAAAAPTNPASCTPAPDGSLQARLDGEIEAEIRWDSNVGHCLGGVRPRGDGVRLLYRGTTTEAGPLLIVFGLAPLRAGESARNVPANLTVVREGTGRFYATQGADKCAFDEVRQVPLEDAPDRYRLEGRGYCTQPARALDGDGAVLVSRFDVVAIIDGSRPDSTAVEPIDEPADGPAAPAGGATR